MIATTGAVVSSVKLSEAVPVLPKLSVWLATMVWAPSASPLGVNDQAPVASAVTVVAMALPSMVKCTAVLASPVPLSASLEVMWSLDDEPVSMASASVRVGPVVLKLKTTALELPVLPAASLTAAVSELLPLLSVTGMLQLPLGCTTAVPSALVPSRSVTVVPASADIHRAGNGLRRLVGRTAALVIATTGAVVSSVKLSEAVPVLPKLSVWLATMVWAPSASPRRGERPGPGGVSRHRGGDGTAVDGEVHHGAGEPGPAQRIVGGDVVAGRVAGIDGQRLGQGRTCGAQIEDHRT